MKGEHGNGAADDMCYSGIGHSCGLASMINEVRPGSRDACTSHADCEASVTLLYCSAVNGLRHTSIA